VLLLLVLYFIFSLQF